MTDRELLELAAKAAGATSALGAWLDGSEPYSSGCGFLAGDRVWNPLTDDGDALRLAVDVPQIDVTRAILAAWQEIDTTGGRREHVRRAITKTAAEIGRAMP